jgi:hypothetical protein
VATPSLCLLALDSTPERDHVVSARAGESKALQHEQNTRGPIALDVPPPGFSLSPTTHSSSFNLSFTFTFAMSITFNPPLDTATVLAVPPSYLDGAELDLCFSAKFDSAEALAAVQRDNVRVELWSNIPVVGRGAGKWGALAFSAETTSVAGDSGDVSASDVQEHTTLRLRFVTHIAARGTQFSYTYRMVQPDGTIKWLGQYGRDGTLLVERADPRIKLTPTLGWSVRSGGETVVENVQDAFEAEVARLNSKLAWSAWTIDRAG